MARNPQQTNTKAAHSIASIFAMSWQDVKQRYAGSYLGAAWAFLYPLALLTFYALIYTFVFKVQAPGLNTTGYILMLSAGLMPVIGFSEILALSSCSIEQHRVLLVNSNVPPVLVPVRAVIAAQMPTLAGLIIVCIGAAVCGYVRWTAIFVPFFWVAFIVFMMGIGWVFSLLTIRYRDITQALGIIGIMMLVLSPAAYTPDMVPLALKPILYLNPLSYFIRGIQESLVFGEIAEPQIWIGAVAFPIAMSVLGYLFFKWRGHVYFDHI